MRLFVIGSALQRKQLMKTFYTATVKYRTLISGEVLEHMVSQDVTDDVAEGADLEALADNLYWKKVHGVPGFLDIVGGGVDETTA